MKVLIYCFSPSAADKNSVTRKLKHNVIEAVNELIQEISTCHEQIAEQAVEHIHHKYALPYYICVLVNSIIFSCDRDFLMPFTVCL